MRLIIGSFCGSLIGAWFMVGLVRQAALRRGLLDLPNARSSHVAPTPRGGGIAIVVLTLAAAAIGFVSLGRPGSLCIAWLIGGGVLAGVGFLDDLRGLSPLIRACMHVAAAILLLNAVYLNKVQASLGITFVAPAICWLILVTMIVWSINLFNFMDGIDGITGVETISLATGTSRQVSISLDRAGAKLLATRHRLSALLTISTGTGVTVGALVLDMRGLYGEA